MTIDSNVRQMAKMIADKLTIPAAEWCRKFGRCEHIPSTMDVFYNTPVSMSSDVTYFNIPSDSINFVYLDFSENNDSLHRIMANYAHLQNVVIISTDAYKAKQYVLTVGNCSNDDAADVISGIIILHLQDNRPVSERKMISLLRGTDDYDQQDDSSCNQKHYNVYKVLAAKRSSNGEPITNNCYVPKK